MLAIAGGKGGTGKTTVALALARSLAESGGDPIVVDADVDMPDLHVLAGTAPTPSTDQLAAGRHIEDALQYTPRLPGVGVVAAGEPESVPAALRRLQRWHGPVLVDCPAGAGVDVARPLRACDRTVLVTTDGPEAVEDTRKTAAVARRLDAGAVVALARGGVADVELPCPVERLPTVEGDRRHAHPRVQAVCQSITGLVTDRNFHS